MSIELKIEALTAAITALTATIAAYGTGPLPSVAVRPSPVAPPAPAPAPVVETPPAVVAPVFVAAPVAAPVAPSAPFSDGKGLIDYVMAVYRTVGPAKGQQIQGILTGMGYANINDVKPEHYGEFHAKVEALR